ncbi:hypothetical protein JX265_008906 [Neoarthrinium moseri]|uniref:Uncharacterized protein n=1 Tax=Neoarthrinium moseri TaxID=1658444 RepID=A0A9Q0ANF4_9PEZI|nr:uncharacterized protein JN550_013215 [Neoarthrinium moseri]KAI1840007.1 hypothetical protein JX266_013794 [Neoarthrinium moseri]KAI1857397.1 hypothetical protein JN550_013215 [Neoarthrinium moseri]KAI1863689.1 hypothetical protein JX265_008906 [Neoarthrinium moseri]
MPPRDMDAKAAERIARARGKNDPFAKRAVMTAQSHRNQATESSPQEEVMGGPKETGEPHWSERPQELGSSEMSKNRQVTYAELAKNEHTHDRIIVMGTLDATPMNSTGCLATASDSPTARHRSNT